VRHCRERRLPEERVRRDGKELRGGKKEKKKERNAEKERWRSGKAGQVLQAHHRRVIYLSAATAAHLPADPVAERGDRCKAAALDFRKASPLESARRTRFSAARPRRAIIRIIALTQRTFIFDSTSSPPTLWSARGTARYYYCIELSSYHHNDSCLPEGR